MVQIMYETCRPSLLEGPATSLPALKVNMVQDE
jgi:hypothetical protein